MADQQKRLIDDTRKLIGLAREHFAKAYQLLDEADQALNGGPRQADLLKDAEHAFDSFWCARYAPGEARRYVWAYQRDRPQLLRLIRTLGLEEVRLRMRRYLANDDPFFGKARHSFGLFVSSVNQHAQQAAAAESDFELDPSPVVGCTHTPPCQSDAEHTRRRRDLHA